MRTAAYEEDVTSDRRRRQNVPRHILCSDKISQIITKLSYCICDQYVLIYVM